MPKVHVKSLANSVHYTVTYHEIALRNQSQSIFQDMVEIRRCEAKNALKKAAREFKASVDTVLTRKKHQYAVAAMKDCRDKYEIVLDAISKAYRDGYLNAAERDDVKARARRFFKQACEHTEQLPLSRTEKAHRH